MRISPFRLRAHQAKNQKESENRAYPQDQGITCVAGGDRVHTHVERGGETARAGTISLSDRGSRYVDQHAQERNGARVAFPSLGRGSDPHAIEIGGSGWNHGWLKGRRTTPPSARNNGDAGYEQRD